MLRCLFPAFLLVACAGMEAAPSPSGETGAAGPASCPPAAELAALGDERVRGEYVLGLAQPEREKLALGLVSCLSDPDPLLRDGVAFTVLSQVMRSQLIAAEAVAALKQDLRAILAGPEDSDGFAKPFAALVLAEVARTDRVAPWMTEDERSGLIGAAHDYLAGLTDYRGFDDVEGWRHGVAHASDLLMQLSLNPRLTRTQADAILDAVALQAGPTSHAYVFGESERLAAPVLYLARRDFFSEDDWAAWFSGLWPDDDPLRENVYASTAALTRKHNLHAFAQTIYASAVASNSDTFAPLGRAAFAFMTSLP